jgi:hypothetical protein
MPTSTEIFKKETINFIKQKFSDTSNILDVGAGNGVYADLLRETFPNIDAVEVFEPYINEFNLASKYREVIIGDINTIPIDISKYSLFILGDVFEHIDENTAKQLLQKLTANGAEVIVAVPFNSPQSDVGNNPYERHLQPRLSFVRMLKSYPNLIPLCIRHDYGVFVTNKVENQHLPIFYKEIEDSFVEKLKIAYPYRSVINVDIPLEEKNVLEIFADGERNKEVTIVTGMWDLGRGEISDGFRRSYDHYKNKFSELLKTPVNMIIFASKEDEEFIWEHRSRENTFIKFIEREEFKTWFEFYDRVQEIRTRDGWAEQAGWLKDSPQATLPDYNPVVMSKMFMLNNATIYNPFNSSYFYWIDAGISSTVHPGYFTHDKVFDKLPEYTDAVEGFIFLSYPYEGSTEIHGFPRADIARYCGTDYVRYVCRGGFFGGTKSDINSMNSLYHGMLSGTLNEGLMGTEESIFTILAHKFPEMISRFELKGDGMVWPFFEKLKNVEEFIQNLPPKPLDVHTAKNNLYILTFNSPAQFRSVAESIQKIDPIMFQKSRKILINNSVNESMFEAYDRLCEEFGFEEIHRENLGVCGGRQFVAEHFDESDADFYMFFEDDMHLADPDQIGYTCKNGFSTKVDGLYNKVVRIMLKEHFDFLKFSFTEFYGSNNVQWAWYNVPQNLRTEYWPNYDKLPAVGIDPNAPRTDFTHIEVMEGISYIKGDIYYSNWPQIVSREGNKKMFLETKWAHPYEQTWMSHMFQLGKTGQLHAGLLLAAPIYHNRFDFYEGTLRKES